MYSPAVEAKYGDFSHLSNWIGESTINQCRISGDNWSWNKLSKEFHVILSQFQEISTKILIKVNMEIEYINKLLKGGKKHSRKDILW